MKKIPLLLLFLLAFVACKDETTDPDPEEEMEMEMEVEDDTVYKKSLIYYNGATWCGICGATGKPVYHFLEDEYQDESNVFIFSGHSSPNSDLYAPAVSELDFPIEAGTLGLPIFFVNFVPNSNLGESELKTAVTSAVDAIVTEVSNADIKIDAKSVSNNQLSVTASVEFAEAVNVLGHDMQLFLYEKEVMAPQSGFTGDIVHSNVVREVAGNTPVATPTVVDGTVVAESEMGTTMTRNFTIDVTGYDADNIGAFVVLWKQDFVDNAKVDEYVNAEVIDL